MKPTILKTLTALLVILLPTCVFAQGDDRPSHRMPVTWGNVQGISHDFLDWQEGSPLQVISVGLGKLDLLNEVVLVNVSNETVVKYQLGWVIANRGQRGPGTVFLGTPADAVAKPWEHIEAGRQGATFSSVIGDLKARGLTRGDVIVGVVYVRFEDGTEWTYPLPLRREFVPGQPAPSYKTKIDPILKKLREKRSIAASGSAA